MALYLEHFGLSEPPFRITPHTDFFFDGADRGATLEALVYAVLHDEGIVRVSGEVGSGKTMLCRVLMERLPASVATIYLATPSLARDEILHAIADELDLKLAEERKTAALRALQEQLIRLYAAGRRVVILVDEAHAMPEETLEQIRLLSNLESNRHKLLQIVLFGQPELDATLLKPALRQLRDRITHAFRVRPLSAPEVAKYISFRIRAAGYRGPELFAPRANALIARASGGLTRRINILADKSLLAAFTENMHGVGARHVRAAIADSEFVVLARARRTALYPYIAAALVAGILMGAAIPWTLAPPRSPQGEHAGSPAVAPRPPVPPAQATLPGAPATAANPAPTLLEPAPSVPEEKAEAAPHAARLSPVQLRRLAGYSSAGRPLLSARIAATHELLERAPDEHYAIELFITENTDPARMERFLLRAREMGSFAEMFVIPMPSGEHYRLRVVLGEFDSREAALEAGRRLPARYRSAFRTSARSFAELRGQI